MDSDYMLVVPDTPDQIQQSTCPVTSSVARRDISIAAANPLSRRRIKFKTRSDPTHNPSGQGNTSTVVPAPSDTDHIFKQAEEARILALSENFEAKLSTQKPGGTTGTTVENEKRSDHHGLDQSSSISNHISCRHTGERNPSCEIRDGKVSQLGANHRNSKFLGVGSDLPSIPVEKPRNRTRTSTVDGLNVLAGPDVFLGSSSGEAKGEVITAKAVAGHTGSTSAVPQRHVGQKKLVRNGCISPSSVAKRSEVDAKLEMCSRTGARLHLHPQLDVPDKSNVIDLTDSSPSTRQGDTICSRLISANDIDTRLTKRLRTDRARETLIAPSQYHANSSNHSEASLSGCNDKGKEISHDILDSKWTGEANARRVCLGAAETSVLNSSFDVNHEQGWRTTHNNRIKLPISLMGKMASSCGQEPGSSAQSVHDHGSAAGSNNNTTGGATTARPESSRNKTIRIGRGRGRYASHSSTGESSHALDNARDSFLASSRTTDSNNHSTQRHGIPVITIEDMSPEVRPTSSGYSNGTSVDPAVQAQLESDEFLARQLQEQLFNESPHPVPTEEIDAVIAMSLQHEEDSRRTSRAVRPRQYSTRGGRASRSNAYQNATRRADNVIHRLQNTASITLGLRAVLATYPGALRIQPNIDLNDYDALLALDENNHQHTGASENQINNLPESVVQSNSIEEPCAVCLENPSVGDTIRHLPCFHKFHKECIDEWLRRKKLCPICKSGIR